MEIEEIERRWAPITKSLPSRTASLVAWVLEFEGRRLQDVEREEAMVELKKVAPLVRGTLDHLYRKTPLQSLVEGVSGVKWIPSRNELMMVIRFVTVELMEVGVPFAGVDDLALAERIQTALSDYPC